MSQLGSNPGLSDLEVLVSEGRKREKAKGSLEEGSQGLLMQIALWGPQTHTPALPGISSA